MLINRDRAHSVMQDYEIDVLIATTHENVAYVSDFHYRLMEMWRSSQYFAVLPLMAEPALIIPYVSAMALIEQPTWVHDVRIYGTFPIHMSTEPDLSEADNKIRGLLRRAEVTPYANAIDALVDVLENRGLADGRLGIDEKNVTPALWQELKSRLPRAKIIDAYSLFRTIRAVKTEEEISRLAASARIAEKAIEHSTRMFRDGMSEQDLAKAFLSYVGDSGALPGSFLVAAGTRTGAFLPASEDYRPTAGDLIKYDVGCIKDKYWSDLARTWVVGRPSQKQRDYFNAVHDTHLESLAAVKPGITVSKLFDLIMSAVRRNGIPHYERTHCGHGIGVEFYDPPMIKPSASPEEDVVIEENMVLCVENPYYEIGFGGFSVEDMVVVTKTGCRNLTTLRRDLWEL